MQQQRAANVSMEDPNIIRQQQQRAANAKLGYSTAIPASFDTKNTKPVFTAPNPAPQTSGGGGAPAPAPAAPSGDDAQIGLYRQQFDQAANDIRNQGGILDQQYGQAKGDIEGALSETQNQANSQKTNLESQYGDILKQQLRTYQDLSRQRQGTFSGLGTLDSSAFQEQQFRGDQALSEQTGRTGLEKSRSLNDVDTQVTAFQRQSQSELAKLATQYQSGKNAIQSALANNDIAKASSIQQALENIRQQAQATQQQAAAFAQQAAAYKNYGADTQGLINGLNANSYAQKVGQQLGSETQNANSTYVVPQDGLADQQPGYVNPTEKKKSFTDILRGYLNF